LSICPTNSAAGFEHYEVSNYALPRFRCRHNCNYWSHENFLGFGPSVHSFWKGSDGTSARRWWNVADLSKYLDRLEGGSLPIASEEFIGAREMLRERIFLGLRSSGLDLAKLASDFDHDFREEQREMVRWVLDDRMALLTKDVLRLTPKGYRLCDEICSRFLP
jgi:oxygen-independent coproporphyrinogen-3 oxidase